MAEGVSRETVCTFRNSHAEEHGTSAGIRFYTIDAMARIRLWAACGGSCRDL